MHETEVERALDEAAQLVPPKDFLQVILSFVEEGATDSDVLRPTRYVFLLARMDPPATLARTPARRCEPCRAAIRRRAGETFPATRRARGRIRARRLAAAALIRPAVSH